jgi:signal transduction histidine kinase
MIRSNFAITRLIIVPYGILLALYLLVVGGGGTWLYLQVRATETRLFIDNIMTEMAPLTEKLRDVDAIAAMRDNQPWLVSDIKGLFTNIPALRNVSVRGGEAGYQMDNNTTGIMASRVASPLPMGAQRADSDLSGSQRLLDETDTLFLVRFDLSQVSAPLIRLDFSFDRSMLLKSINDELITIKQSVLMFGVIGAVSILIALFITAMAMRTTRRLESHFQGIYQRASLTETAAQLVHDLRNHLAALRANAKALLVSPQQMQEIVGDIDQEIVSLNDKLSMFLDLTRQRDEDFTAVDVGEMIDDAVRLAQPVLAKHGLTVETAIPPALPQPVWQKVTMRDALLNVIINAGQSGQREGVIHVSVTQQDGNMQITVADRGRGIDKRHLPRLFEAFYTTREDGNGLGLAIVQRIVAAHQGRVYAENRSDGGAKVVLILPLKQKESPPWWKKFKKTFLV